MTELKPCPFCGGKAKRRYEMPYSWIECAACKAASPFAFDEQEQRDGMKIAVDAWNRRAVRVALAKWLTWEEKFPEKEAPNKNNLGVFCTACGLHADSRFVYCPSCGAKMENGLPF